MNKSRRNQDFRHFIVLTDEAVNRSRLLLIIFFTAEKSLSISDDIARIERISIVIRDNRENRVR